MRSNWDLFFNRVLQDEGTRYEDVPGDNGGPTKCGITIADVARWYKLTLKYTKSGVAIRGAGDWDKAKELVKDLDAAKASEIYKAFYWDACRADDLPSGLDYAVVDYAVNSGKGKAVSTLGRLVGVLGTSVTDKMLEAVKATDLENLITHFQECRRQFLVEISQPTARYMHNMKFRDGWLKRESRVRKVALDLATHEPAPAVAQTLPKATAPVAAPDLPPPGQAVAKDLRSVSRKLALISTVKRVATFLGLTTVTTDSLNLTQTVEQSKGISDVVEQLVANPVLLSVVVVTVVVVGLCYLLEGWHTDDYNAGRWIPSGGDVA